MFFAVWWLQNKHESLSITTLGGAHKHLDRGAHLTFLCFEIWSMSTSLAFGEISAIFWLIDMHLFFCVFQILYLKVKYHSLFLSFNSICYFSGSHKNSRFLRASLSKKSFCTLLVQQHSLYWIAYILFSSTNMEMST